MSGPSVINPPPRRRKWLRVLGFLFAGVFLLLIVGYFVVTSSAFFKSVILPRASQALNAQITVSDASISPFSQVILKDLKVQTTGSEPLAQVPELRVRYSLGDILRGNIKVNELTAVSPIVVVQQDANGKSNLDPILQSGKSGESKSSTSSKSSGEPMRLDIGAVRIENGTVRYAQGLASGKRDLTEVKNLNLTVNNVRNGGSGKGNVGADLSTEKNGPSPAESATAQAKLAGDLVFALSPNLDLTSAKGNASLEVAKATGSLQQANGLNVALVSDLSPTEITELALRFAREKALLGQLRVSGPFNAAKQEGTLAVELSGLDKQLLNLVGAPNGLDFGSTRIGSTNKVVLAQAGKKIEVAGRLNVDRFQVTRTNQSTPVLDISANYDTAIDLNNSSALLNTFVLSGIQNGKPLLQGSLTSPFAYSWAAGKSGAGDSTLAVKLTELNLVDWKPFIGDYAPAGQVSGDLEVRSQNAGDRLAFDLKSQGSKLTITAGGNTITEGGLNLQVAGVSTNKQVLHLQTLKFDFLRQNQPVVSANGQGLYQMNSGSGEFQLAAKAEIPTATKLVPMDADFSAGHAEVNAQVSLKGDIRDLTGSLAITNLTGRFASNQFQAYSLASDFQVAMTAQEANIKKLTAALGSGSRPGGRLDITGTYGLSNQVANVNARFLQLNQDGLRPFTDPMMEDMKAVLLTVNGDANAQYRPAGVSTYQANLSITNLVLTDSDNQISAAPLEARLKADVDMQKNIAELKRVELGLNPTKRAPNNMAVIVGRVDLSGTNGIEGKLKATADVLDITRWYDVYMGDAPEEVAGLKPAKSGGGTGGSGAPAAEEELEPLIMPLRNFVTDITIGKMYLRELEMTNMHSSLLLDGGKVVLDPFQFALNGAPAKTGLKMDMGVPGWKYDLEFSAQKSPVTPLVDSFMPSLRGQAAGTLDAGLHVAAQGITDTNIQKSLTGNFDLNATNLNIAIPAIKNPLLKAVVNVVGIIPQILKDPKNQLGSLAGAVLGSTSGKSSGFSGELEQAPIDVIALKGTMRPGLIDLENSLVQSSTFQAGASGKIETQPILTNSPINVPLSVSLRRNLAEKFNLMPAGTPTNAVYVALPNYVTIGGTVGQPKPDINYGALAGTALQQFGGKIPGVDKNTSNLIQGLGSVLSGRGSAGTNAPANPVPAGTNAPAQGKSGLGGLDRFLGSALGVTNAPAAGTNTVPATNQSPVGSVLDQLLRPRK